MEETANVTVTAPVEEARTGFWPYGWWNILDHKIGVIPLPIYVILLCLIATALHIGNGKIASDILASIGILAVGGFTCGEIGTRLPLIKHLGAGAIFATFLPSYLVYAHLLPEPVIESTKTFYQASNFLYLYISCIIVGSILGMGRDRLIKGAIKIFVPLVCGVIAA